MLSIKMIELNRDKIFFTGFNNSWILQNIPFLNLFLQCQCFVMLSKFLSIRESTGQKTVLSVLFLTSCNTSASFLAYALFIILYLHSRIPFPLSVQVCLCVCAFAWSYHDGLLNQCVTVLTHVLQDFIGSIVASCSGRLGGHSQWVDQSLQTHTE